MTMGHRLRSGSARRGLAFISAAALLTSLMIVPAFAEHSENTTELEADDAVGAAIAWSELTFDAADHVIVGRDDVFADNLTSGVLQGTDSPLLLTDSDALSDETATEIERLGATTATVLGGEAAISEDVKEELEDLGLTVERIGGATRVETSVAVATEGASDADSIIVARAFKAESSTDESQAFADSLAAGAWAAESGMPVLLTTTNELHEAVETYIEANDEIVNAFIVGGTSAVGAAVQSELEALGLEVERVSGATRFETAVAVAEARGFDSAADADEVILVEGQDEDSWAGGFAAAAYSAINGAPIVLANGDTIPEPTEDFLAGSGETASLASHGATHLVCGPLVSSDACAEAADIMGLDAAPHTNQDFDVTPGAAATNTVSTTTDPNTNRGARTYTVTGLDNTKQYDIALIPGARVTDDDGQLSFRDTEGTEVTTDDNNQADDICESTNYDAVNGDPDGALIETVNGADVTDAKCVNNVTPTNGAITFVVDSEDRDSARAIVFQDADNDNQLDLDANNEPTEAFAVSGNKNWVPSEAAFGAYEVDVVEVDTAQDHFVGDDLVGGSTNFGTFYYDSNDNFFVGGTRVSMAEFESVLSVGDDVSGNYRPDPAGASDFNLTDTAPAGPTGVTATAGDFDSDTARDDVRVTWTKSTSEGVDYDVKRVTDPDPGTTNDGDAECAAAAGTTVANDTTETTVTETNVPNGTYFYCVRSEQGSGDVQSQSAWVGSNQVTTPGAADTDDPIAQDAEVTTSGGFGSLLDSGDVLKACFNEAMRAPDAGDAIQVEDGDGDIAILTNGGNAVFTLGSASTTDVNAGGATTSCPATQTLVITVTGAVNDANTGAGAGNNDGIQIPVTATDTSGVTDLAGNTWVPDGEDIDRVFDIETEAEANEVQPQAVTTGATDADADDDLTAGDTVTIDFDEGMVFANGDTVTIEDAGTDVVVLTLAAGCTAAEDDVTWGTSDSDTLIMVLCDDPAPVIDLPATITGASGVDDGEGNVWSPTSPAGQDVTVNE